VRASSTKPRAVRSVSLRACTNTITCEYGVGQGQSKGKQRQEARVRARSTNSRS
jgi:hypothetical protein